MALLMGIDIGTSSAKAVVFDDCGNEIAIASEAYSYDVPSIGYAEQDPEVWWKATVSAVREVLQKVSAGDIAAIGLSGQMHGMVALDRENRAVRKAILHCDQRSSAMAKEAADKLGKDFFSKITFNPAFSGFQLISLMWLKENEPENYKRIYKVVCPKDYIRLRLCGEIGTDFSDASATLAFDMQKQCWADDMITALGIDAAIFPETVGRSFDIAGEVTQYASAQTGLAARTKVTYGGGDQSMQLLGTGVYEPGTMTVAIGSSAQIITVTDNPVYNKDLNTHTFLSALPDQWFCMGAVLTGGTALDWFKKTFMPQMSFAQISSMAGEISPGCDGLVFFPCLAGERTPYMDSDTRGILIGMSYLHDHRHFARAVMEGVTFEIRNSIEILKSLGCGMSTVIASSGGAKSDEWLHIQADIYGLELSLTQTSEQTALGAAITAGIGCGVFKDAKQGCGQMVKLAGKKIAPDPERHKLYTDYYNSVFKQIYSGCGALFGELKRLCS